jgi:hypothetical protein
LGELPDTGGRYSMDSFQITLTSYYRSTIVLLASLDL